MTSRPDCQSCRHYDAPIQDQTAAREWQRLKTQHGALAESCCHPTAIGPTGTTFATATAHRGNACGADGAFHNRMRDAERFKRRPVRIEHVNYNVWPSGDQTVMVDTEAGATELDVASTTIRSCRLAAGETTHARVRRTEQDTILIEDWEPVPER